MNFQDRITINPAKRSGKACIRNLRITVAVVPSEAKLGVSSFSQM